MNEKYQHFHIPTLISVLIIVVMTLIFMAKSDASDLDEDFQSWNQITGTYHITPEWMVNMDAQARFNHDAGDLGQVIMRPSFGYQLDKHWSLWLGYAYQGSYNAHKNGSFNDEHRVFQQLSYADQIGDLKYSARTRVEERTYDFKDLDANVRARQMFRLEYPIAAGFYAAGQEEVFVNLSGNQAAQTGFDQNRLWAGIGYYFTPKIKLETGYMNQYVNVAHKDNQLNHIVSTSLYFNY